MKMKKVVPSLLWIRVIIVIIVCWVFETSYILTNLTPFAVDCQLSPGKLVDNHIAIRQRFDEELDATLNNCANYTPECEPRDVVEKRWGEGAAQGYRPYVCCVEHSRLRDAVGQVFDAIELNGGTAWLEGGAVLGIVRHNGTLIPWDRDADLHLLVGDDNDIQDETLKGLTFIPIEDLDGWVEGLVKTLNEITEPPASGEFKWTFRNYQLDKRKCIHYQLFKQRILFNDVVRNSVMVDLLGVTWHLAPKRIDGFVRHSVNYPGCWRNEKVQNEFSYYLIPPAKCQFYDRTVMCPRDAVGYAQTFFGSNVLEQAKSKKDFYKSDLW